MSSRSARSSVVPVGIDLGTTYSCLSYLTPQGQPVTLANDEGELATPSVVLFDGKEVIVGTEALRYSVSMPGRVVQHAKRFMGDPHQCWVFDGRVYRPKDISAFILKKLLHTARERLGPVHHAVITVPAQFSELQRRDTVEAGLEAGLERVDIINEPVAAALCYVLSEGMWFAELANDQTVLVFDLGGGTLDLSLVQYNRQQARVIASGGDLKLGGIDWNQALQEYVCDQFAKEAFNDPRQDPESMQALLLEVEQAKRSLSVRPRSSLLVQHAGRRKTYQIDRATFEELTKSFVIRSEQLTQRLLKENKIGWARVDAVLATGGASRMPMIRNMLQRISGTTLNQSLSPDQSISHGAAYYAGMLLSGRKLESIQLDTAASERLSRFRQQSVSGRSLGLLVRNLETQEKEPHYLIPANTPLPCAYRQQFGTVVPNQKQIHLQIVESGTSPEEPFVSIGDCVISDLPLELPVATPIEVTFRYDEQGRLHVEATESGSGRRAEITIQRSESAVTPPTTAPQPGPLPPLKTKPRSTAAANESRVALENSRRPVPLCNHCGEVLPESGLCPKCGRPGKIPDLVPAKPGSQRDPEKMEKTEPLRMPPKPPPPRP